MRLVAGERARARGVGGRAARAPARERALPERVGRALLGGVVEGSRLEQLLAVLAHHDIALPDVVDGVHEFGVILVEDPRIMTSWPRSVTKASKETTPPHRCETEPYFTSTVSRHGRAGAVGQDGPAALVARSALVECSRFRSTMLDSEP